MAPASGPHIVLIGESQPMRQLGASLARVARSPTTVLLTGETGTGKELAARYIHAASPRHDQRFVVFNCAAIPDTLVESELFGYERGAFSGANAPHSGLLHQAHRGTVFLDEIGEMSLVAQAKILRAIEAQEIVPLGGRRPVPLDVRIIAATNVDLEQAVASGRFRRDLYFRLNVVRITVPPLRERRSDVPALVAHYVRQFAPQFGTERHHFTDAAVSCLVQYSWPGNVRELKNLVESALVCGQEAIDTGDLPPHIVQAVPGSAATEQQERERLLAALLDAHWNKSRAARQLRCSRMTLYRKMNRLKIHRRG